VLSIIIKLIAVIVVLAFPEMAYALTEGSCEGMDCYTPGELQAISDWTFALAFLGAGWILFR
jgi:hypothetical protein